MARDKGASSFDELAIGLSSGTVSRRRALRLFGSAILGGALASIPTVAGAKPKPGKCHKDAQCPVGTTCQNGECLTPQGCQPGETLCAGQCVDLSSDPENCGACGNVC